MAPALAERRRLLERKPHLRLVEEPVVIPMRPTAPEALLHIKRTISAHTADYKSFRAHTHEVRSVAQKLEAAVKHFRNQRERRERELDFLQRRIGELNESLVKETEGGRSRRVSILLANLQTTYMQMEGVSKDVEALRAKEQRAESKWSAGRLRWESQERQFRDHLLKTLDDQIGPLFKGGLREAMVDQVYEKILFGKPIRFLGEGKQ